MRVALLAFFLLAIMPGCSSVFYYPDRYLHYRPEKLGYKHEELKFESKDGTKLVAWFFPAEGGKAKAKGTIIQFHGNAENLSSHYVSLAWLTKHGYNLFIFDYRGYGGSEGEPDQQGTYKDGLAALDKAWELKSGRRFIVYGQSLGGAIAMRAFADFSHRDQTSLVVMDSTFLSYKTVARRVLGQRWWLWPFSPLALLLVSNEYGAKDALVANKTRLLVIHDKRDPSVPFANGEDIYELATSPKDFWVLDDGRHIEVFAPYNKSYRDKFVQLLESL